MSSEPDAPSDPLESARLKARRAERQFNVVKRKLERFLASEPYAPWVEIDDEGSELTLGIDVRRRPAPEWSVLIGEIVHNLHSALDHAAWQLVIRDGGAPHDRTQFPIFLDSTKFGWEQTARGKLRGMMEGMCKESIALLERAQPFSTGEDTTSPLWRLRELSVFDKHKALHLAAGVIDQWRLVFGPLPAGNVRAFGHDPGPFEASAVMAKLQLTPGAFSPEGVDVNSPPVIKIVFGKDSPVSEMLVIEGLDAIGKRVWAIINEVAEARFAP